MDECTDDCMYVCVNACAWSMIIEFVQARVIEDARHAASGGVNPQGKAISKRPDLVARTKMEKAGATVNTQKVAGHVPGIAIFDRSAFDGGFLACDWGFLTCDRDFLACNWGFLACILGLMKVIAAFWHAFMISLAVRPSCNLIDCLSLCLSVC